MGRQETLQYNQNITPVWSWPRGIVPAVAGCVLLMTASTKLLDIHQFHLALERQGLVPLEVLDLAVWSVPLLEAGAGLWMLWCLARHSDAGTSSFAGAGVFFVFALYTAALWFHPPVKPAPCGCGFGSPAPVESWAPVVSRNLSAVAGLIMNATLGRKT